MKIKLGIFTSVILLLVSASASAAEIRTSSADNITYYGATLHGYAVGTSSEISSYGFEVWSDNTSAQKTQVGTGSCSGNFEAKFVMPDSTTYYYRAYIKDKSSKYYYGDERSVTTSKRSITQSPVVNFNINVESPSKIDFAASPNKFLLNNLIINQPEKLQLIAGNDFNGIDGVAQNGGENVFLNQHFINHYYSDPLLRSTLTIFDGLVYNRDDWANEVATSNIICDAVAGSIYNISNDTVKDTIRSVYSDMGVKRFSGAINNVISNDYTSSDKRTFGYERGEYRMLEAISDGSTTTKKVIDGFNKGEEKLIDGIEAYQSYYFDKIAPKYANASNNFLQISKYLNEKYDTLSDTDRSEYLKNYYSYLKEVHTYDRLGFADEKASKWKKELETKYWGKETKEVLDYYGKTFSFGTATIGTIKAIDQVTRNKKALEGTFTSLRNTTSNKKLQITLDDYLYKMNNNTGDFIISTAQNIYETFAKKEIKKAVNEEIKSAEIDLVAQTSGLYTAKVTDKALGAANQVLIAADTGAFFAEKIYGTKTVLEKAIELKYLWNVENESKAMLIRDLNTYSQSGTEEDAAKVMNDLYWLKALKLRAITAANDLYKANGDNWLSLVDKSLKETADGVDKIFTNQRDALINASLTENQYTSEPLTLTSGETFTVFSARNTGDGSIVKDGKSTILSKAKARLSGGVDIASGAALNVIGASGTTYIPYVNLSSGGRFVVNNSKVIIGELKINGTAVLSGDITASECTVTGGTSTIYNLTVENSYTQNGGTVNLSNGRLMIKDGMQLKSGTINNGTITTYGLADISGTITGTLNAKNNVKSNSAKITSLNVFGTEIQTISGAMTVTDLEFNNKSSAEISGTISVSGLLTNTSTRLTGGKCIELLSSGKIGGTTYKSDLTLNGANISDVTFEKSLYTKGTSTVSGIKVNNMLYQTGTLNLNNDVSVKGDVYNSGKTTGNGTLKLYGDLSGSGTINSLAMCSDKAQSITSSFTVNDFYNRCPSLNVGAAVTVNGKIYSDYAMKNGSNLQLSSSGSFGAEKYMGDITLKGLSGNLPAEFNGNINAGSATLNLTEPSVVNGNLTLSGTTLNLNDTTLTMNGTYSGNGTVKLTNSEMIFNGITSPSGTITLNSSKLTANKIITNSATITINPGSSFDIKSDITNSGKISGETLNINGDFVNNGTVNVNLLNVNTKNRALTFSGNALNTVDLNISGKGALNLGTSINVSGEVTNNGTAVDEDKIILPFDSTAPLKTLTSTNGYTIDGRTVTVNGKCNISGGAISLTNGARLILNQGFTASGTTFIVDETSEIIIKRYALLSSFGEIVNNGKITFGGDVSLSSSKFGGNGEYILLGDLYLSSASVNKPKSLILSGGTAQKLWGGTMNFDNLTLENTSVGGVTFGSDATYCGELINSDTKVSGNLTKTE